MSDAEWRPGGPLAEGQRQATVGTDPWLDDLARAAYDPVSAARATGRLAGLGLV
ncbi:MAG: hypothetical protein IRY97_03735, partial [Thermomicrobiaceae bacterium]|nr:hypothetical protein [Thermomicrobiaceae bacterium]